LFAILICELEKIMLVGTKISRSLPLPRNDNNNYLHWVAVMFLHWAHCHSEQREESPAQNDEKHAEADFIPSK
jgi:hypothetical protein